MNKSPAKNNMSSISLLSAYLSSTTEMPKESTSRRLPQRRLDSTGTVVDDRGCHPSKASEPPKSLGNSGNVVPGLKLSTTRGTRNQRATALSPSHDLASSPLSSRPFQTLTKEYDMDTWRMYQRIQAARNHSDKDFLSLVQQTVDRITYYDSSGGYDDSECPISNIDVVGFAT
eukprot:CAMPEP_0176293004 /NCGR_PEP_ID=MMETSP0121_2-20121125/56379_1 /TAXON_ID=160619 /ORGANISM="Kryptoperidinium foliaceum, Strain CCMP 1326" /LENGTH=172 /DNA_ID=CAMNT_0017633941 /DNA_START=38 /DNA_END=553 /DNA_ORIENTATION=-